MNRPIRIALTIMLLAAAVLVDVPAARAVGTTIHVDTAADNTTSDADCTLREAINNANADSNPHGECEAGTADDVIVFDGNYTITLTSELPVINTILTITGNGEANSIIEADDCNPVTLPGACTPVEYRILSVDGSGDLTLEELTLRHGNCSTASCSSSPGPNNAGGAITNAGTLDLTYATLAGNSAVSGGALRNNGTLTMYGATFSGNKATHGGAYHGDGAFTISWSTFDGNGATVNGGALFDYGPGGTITASTFTSNTGTTGAIHEIGTGTLTVERSTFSQNSASSSFGGGILLSNASLALSASISNSTFTDNSAASGGAAIFNNGQSLDITNSTIAGNDSGGGLYLSDGLDPGSTTVYNTIISDNTGGDCVLDGSPTFTANSYNQDSDGSCDSATQKSVAQLGLEDLEDNGGGIQTMALSPRSSAIDAADNGVCPAFDQRAFDRPWAYTCDVGAYEFHPCFVNDDASGDDDGTAWGDAYLNLQTALANPACTAIWVAAGLYKPAGGESDEFNVPPGVQLYGGFAGTEELTSERSPGTYPSVLSGDIDNNDTTDGKGIVLDDSYITGDNSDHVMLLDGTSTPIDVGTIIDGFTITAGQADYNGHPDFLGGGLYCNGGGGQCSPMLRNLTFSGNAAIGVSASGGALYNQGDNGESSPTLVNVTFRGNDAESDGGAIRNQGTNGGTASPSLTNVTFYGNTSDNDGGAMTNYASSGGFASPTLTNVTFNGNSTGGSGGAIASFAAGSTSVTTLVNSILWGDSASGSGDEIYNANASSTMSYSVVQGGEPSVEDSDEDPFTGGAGNLSDTPQLGSLGGYGGFTPVIPFAPAGSSALDTGVGGSCPAADQRGATRPQGVGCDRGAYEVIVEDTVGINGGGIFYLRNENAAGPADNTFGFGWSGPDPIVGDWDGDGMQTVGIDDGGWFFLRNSNSAGPADAIFQYGWAGATPLVGDWDGDGLETIGIYSAGWFFLRNSLTPGPANEAFSFGWVGPTPIVGDWNGDGTDTIGIHSGDTFFLRNSNSAGPADVVFSFGWAGPTPVAGDWDADGVDTIGIVDSGNFYLRNSNSAGPADLTFGYGWGGATPLFGTWDLLP